MTFKAFLMSCRRKVTELAQIIGAAFLDEHLKQLLTNFMVDDKKEVELFLSGDVPLGAFGARIRAAYCLGVLSKEYFEALKLIKAVRNAFAHQLHGRSFDDGDIVKACERLQALMPIKSKVTPTPRKMFEASVVFILMDISTRTLTILQKRCRTPPAPSVAQ
jgi:DNA-binding MltR family transcriptional regulator